MPRTMILPADALFPHSCFTYYVPPHFASTALHANWGSTIIVIVVLLEEEVVNHLH
jgi:hypothetical protein